MSLPTELTFLYPTAYRRDKYIICSRRLRTRTVSPDSARILTLNGSVEENMDKPGTHGGHPPKPVTTRVKLV